MCGILFGYGSQLSSDQWLARGRQALATLTHRGPDEASVVELSDGLMGHVRLSIVDIDHSQQPMRDQTGRYALCFNGEIYNYKVLRAELAVDWHFTTDGDTEVLLAGLIRHGPDFLGKMEGMWAFVLWDTRERRMLASRDRFGEKPLYYVDQSPGAFFCGSELPALRTLMPDAEWQEDLDSTSDYFRYGFFLPGCTAYVGVNEVLPGHYIEWRLNENPQQKRYWSLPSDVFSGTQADAEQLLRDRLDNSVALRLNADIEVGALLSGGMDSTIVVGLAAAKQARLKTFTMGFSDASYDESAFARLAAKKFHCDHHESILPSVKADTVSALLAAHVGQPFADPSLLPMVAISQLAAQSVKVALTGDGGDELFCGYERYRARALMRWYSRLPASLRATAAKVLDRLPESKRHHSSSLFKKAQLFMRQVESADSSRPYVAPELFTSDELSRLLPGLADRGHAPPILPERTQFDDIDNMMVADTLVYMPQDILQKTDRASMAHSLELRSPFLDSAVVELAFSLPTSWQAGMLSGKQLLRRSFSDLLPAAISRRGKKGFAVPVGVWFQGPLGEAMLNLLRRDPGVLAVSTVEMLLQSHRLGVRDHGLRLWAIYAYLLCRHGQCQSRGG